MSKVSPNDLPIMFISANSDLSEAVFYQKMQDEYLPRIQQIKGVAEITILGGQEREIQVEIDKEKLKMYQIPLIQVIESLKRANLDLPIGTIDNTDESNSIRLIGKFKNLSEIENVQVAMPFPNNPILLKDIAKVVDGIKDVPQIPANRVAVGGSSPADKYGFTKDAILLLEKGADEVNFMHVPKNATLYAR